MKKLLIYSMLFSSFFANAQSTVVVDSEGALLYPDKDTFIDKNEILNKKDFTELESIVEDNTSKINSNTSNISSNASSISSNSSKISVNVSNIASNLTKINTNTANIATNSVSINSNASSISEIQSELIPKSSLSVLVDTYYSGARSSSANYLYTTYSSTTTNVTAYFTDCVLKVLDKDGNLLYFFSTTAYFSTYLQTLHGTSVYDNTATVYYYASGRNSNLGKSTPKIKREFPSSAWTNYCIASYEESISGDLVYRGLTRGYDNRIRITAIQIYPSAKFHDIFLNPENSIIVNRQFPTFAEKDGTGGYNGWYGDIITGASNPYSGGGRHLFRPAIIQYLR